LHRLQGAEPELLLAAFKTLDVDGKGTVDPEKLRNLLTSEGEAFSPEEMEDMLTAAVDSSTDLIHYEDYVPKLMVRIKREIFLIFQCKIYLICQQYTPY